MYPCTHVPVEGVTPHFYSSVSECEDAARFGGLRRLGRDTGPVTFEQTPEIVSVATARILDHL